MKCPFCNENNDRVVDSRESGYGHTIRRRRECLECGRRYTSYERIEEIPFMVVKRDGSRAEFDRKKLLIGLYKACEKRPVPASGSTRSSMLSSNMCTNARTARSPPRKSANSSWIG